MASSGSGDWLLGQRNFCPSLSRLVCADQNEGLRRQGLGTSLGAAVGNTEAKPVRSPTRSPFLLSAVLHAFLYHWHPKKLLKATGDSSEGITQAPLGFSSDEFNTAASVLLKPGCIFCRPKAYLWDTDRTCGRSTSGASCSSINQCLQGRASGKANRSTETYGRSHLPMCVRDKAVPCTTAWL